jgi:predicted MPP superfamily phosphohydrolase
MKKISIIGIIFLNVILFSGCFNKNIKIVKTEAEIIQEKLEQRTAKEPLKLGVITDVHAYGKKVGEEWEINWRSKDAMSRFIDKMNNEFKPVAVVEIGDLVDGRDHNSLEDWKIMDGMMQKLKMPYFNTIGNHEMRSFEKSVWKELAGQEQTYYYNDFSGYRIIILDGNHFPGGKDTSPEKEYYPGELGSEQWQWLEATLKDAAMNDKDPVVFVHQPPIETDVRPDWFLFPDGAELQELFSKYKVRAVFSGHIERLCDQVNNGVEYFVLQGFWKGNGGLKREYRFRDAGNFYSVTISPEGTNVKGEYRVFDQKNKTNKKTGASDRINHWDNFVLNQEEYTCQDRSKLMESNKSGLTENEKSKSKKNNSGINDKIDE